MQSLWGKNLRPVRKGGPCQNSVHALPNAKDLLEKPNSEYLRNQEKRRRTQSIRQGEGEMGGRK